VMVFIGRLTKVMNQPDLKVNKVLILSEDNKKYHKVLRKISNRSLTQVSDYLLICNRLKCDIAF